MKKNKYLLLISLSLASPLCFSQQAAGFYIGGSVGQSSTTFDSTDYSLATPGITESKDKTDTGFKVYGGYNFTRNLAVEGGYADLGKPSYKYTDAATGASASAYLENTAWFLVGKGTVWVQPNIGLFGRLGLTSNRSEISASVPAALVAQVGNPPSASKTQTEFVWGVGGEYAINRNFGVRLEYEDFGKFGNDSDTGRTKSSLWSLGVTYAF